jgi:predicted outer membrane repeat protein
VYSGDLIELPSTSLAVAETVSAADFTLTASPSSQTITDGQSASFVLTVSPQGSFTGAINFSCGNLPASATCSFRPASITPDSKTVTTTLTITTVGHASVFTRIEAPNGRPLYPYAGVASLLALLSLLLASSKERRRSIASSFALVPLLAVVIGAVAGCAGSSSRQGTPVGTSQVQVTANSAATTGGVIHSTSLTLTIQP